MRGAFFVGLALLADTAAARGNPYLFRGGYGAPLPLWIRIPMILITAGVVIGLVWSAVRFLCGESRGWMETMKWFFKDLYHAIRKALGHK